MTARCVARQLPWICRWLLRRRGRRLDPHVITLGFDTGTRDGSTVLIACQAAGGQLVLLGSWGSRSSD